MTLDWLAKILRLPERFLSSSPGPGGAVIQGSAGESVIVILLAAMRRAQRRKAGADEHALTVGGDEGATDVGRDRCVVYCSDQTHAIVKKACMVLGLRCRALETSPSDNFALRGAAVSAAIEEDRAAGMLPVAVIGTSGTTTSCAFDALPELADACEPHGLWLHVDAAYGGAYACLDELAPRFAGLERETTRDSIRTRRHVHARACACVQLELQLRRLRLLLRQVATPSASTPTRSCSSPSTSPPSTSPTAGRCWPRSH